MNYLTGATTAAVILASALACCPLVADDGQQEVVKGFIAYVDQLDSIDAATRAEIRSLVQEMTADPYSQVEAITSALARIYPDYEKAILASQSEDVDTALAGLRPYVESGDKYLAADSSFFMARTLMNRQRHEEAVPVLERLSGELSGFTMHAGPALYFAGVAEASLLENQRALQSFETFLEKYPDAPERLRVAAWRQMQTLKSIEEGSLEDVLQRMDYSQRRLQIENTGEATQDQQKRIVTMLQSMIQEEEKKECSSSNSKKNTEEQQESQQQAKSENKSDSQGKSTTGGSSNNPNGTVKRSFDDGPASPWSRLRERSRDAANNAIKQKLPARYRSVVEKYYETISGNEDGGK
jgi:tetratricopeptide (TPR) repeat protein